jgi:hypothetical protein
MDMDDRDEVAELRRQVDALLARVEELEARAPAGAPVADAATLAVVPGGSPGGAEIVTSEPAICAPE